MKVAAIIPCFRVRRHLIEVVRGALEYVDRVYVVDDCCPEESGTLVAETLSDSRLTVIHHSQNAGVGGAMVTGYKAALADGCDVIIKMDGDGQMDPRFIPALVRPIADGNADYTKGNRFFSIDYLRGMPRMRLFGNSVLSLVNKISTGYWNVMDPTNGYTAIHAAALRWIPLSKLSQRYFFESDMLFRLATIRAVVRDVPIPARYGDEVSNLKTGRVALDFPFRYLSTFVKRFCYCYLLREINVGTIETALGAMLLTFGFVFGGIKWYQAIATAELTPIGSVMLPALCVILGVQFLLAALTFDIANVPNEPIQRHWSLDSAPASGGVA